MGCPWSVGEHGDEAGRGWSCGADRGTSGIEVDQITVGRAAGDVVLWDGDPLELSSAPVSVWIDGVKQPVDSHQARLRERYKDLDETYLPKAYDW